MNAKFIVVAALTLVGAFGLSMSGCNRDKSAMASATSRRKGQNRPAEVLSASAYRPPLRTYQSTYQSLPETVASPEPVLAVQPPMRPVSAVPAPELAMTRAKFEYSASQPARAIPGLAPVSAAPAPVMAMAPIPELEPRRYVRPIAGGARSYQPAEIMMQPSAVPAITPVAFQDDSNREINNALSPITASPFLERTKDIKWVSSPNTAMRR